MPASASHPPTPCHSRLGLALAGGGPLGIIYEIGALQALEEAVVGLRCQALPHYVGVSAGAVIAASLANGFSPVELGRIFISNDFPGHALDPGIFLRPAFREYARRLARLPGLSLEACGRWLRHPLDTGPLQALAHLSRALPAGIFDNEPIRRELLRFFSLPGHSDDFRELESQLNVVAVDLDSGEPVVFGHPDRAHIPISRAVQASSALPGLYPPVEIEGRHHVDGALVKTLHASVALETGVDLLFCINPIVPIDAEHAAGPDNVHLSEGGLSVVMSQALRSLIHSRLGAGMARYEALYPQADVLLFEPERADAMLFFSNVFSFSNRDRVCEYAYQTMRRDLWQRRGLLAPVLARHGLGLDEAVLCDSGRCFADSLAAHRRLEQRRRYPRLVSNRLHTTLDRLQGWLQQES